MIYVSIYVSFMNNHDYNPLTVLARLREVVIDKISCRANFNFNLCIEFVIPNTTLSSASVNDYNNTL